MWLRLGILTLPALVALLGGCTDQATSSGVCTDDNDCQGGFCNLETNQCVPRASRQVGLEVVPPSGNKQGWVLQEFPSAKPGPDAQLSLRLNDVLSVQGQVFASHDLESPVPAKITAWRPSLLAGRPDVQVTGSTDDTDDHRFVLWLEGGYEYTFYIKPQAPFDTRYPPRVVTLRLDEHLKHDFVLDGDDRAIEVQGKVVNAMGEPLPFSVQVRAHRSGTSVRSTLGVTCSPQEPDFCPDGVYDKEDAGHFAIRIPPGVEAYTLQVESVPLPAKNLQEHNPIPMIPTTECTGKVLGLVETQGAAVQRITTPFKLPPFAYAKLYTVSVVGGEVELREPVTSAQLRFVTSLTAKPGVGFDSCSASFSYTAITDAEGKLQLPLIPGDAKNRPYEVTAISPASSAYASQYLTTDIGSAGGVLQTIVLEDRYTVSGMVLGPEDQGVAGAMIEARGIATTNLSQDQTAGGLPPGKATATADEEGLFVLHVDPGIYNLHIRPPEDSGLPQFGLDKRKVDGPVEGLVLRAPLPSVLEGRVLGADGKPVAGFTVNSYETVTDSVSTEQAVLRAYGTTDGEGRFRLMLAP